MLGSRETGGGTRKKEGMNLAPYLKLFPEEDELRVSHKEKKKNFFNKFASPQKLYYRAASFVTRRILREVEKFPHSMQTSPAACQDKNHALKSSLSIKFSNFSASLFPPQFCNLIADLAQFPSTSSIFFCEKAYFKSIGGGLRYREPFVGASVAMWVAHYLDTSLCAVREKKKKNKGPVVTRFRALFIV